jgi:mannose-6-phosphate isomerase-like protein (cupin superfamily)
VLPDQGECFGVFGDRIRYILTSEDTDAQFDLLELRRRLARGRRCTCTRVKTGSSSCKVGTTNSRSAASALRPGRRSGLCAARRTAHFLGGRKRTRGEQSTAYGRAATITIFELLQEFDTGAPDVHKISRIGNEHGVTFLTPEGVTDHMAQRQCEAGLQTRFLNQGEGERATVGDSQVRFILTQADTGGACALLELTMQPGSNVALHVHSCEDEVFIVQSGCYEFQLGNERVQAGPQTVIYAARGVPHAFQVEGEESGHMLVLTMPGAFEEYWRRCVQFGIAPHSGEAEQLDEEYGLSHKPAL